jgi:amino acid transporter
MNLPKGLRRDAPCTSITVYRDFYRTNHGKENNMENENNIKNENSVENETSKRNWKDIGDILAEAIGFILLWFGMTGFGVFCEYATESPNAQTSFWLMIISDCVALVGAVFYACISIDNYQDWRADKAREGYGCYQS